MENDVPPWTRYMIPPRRESMIWKSMGFLESQTEPFANTKVFRNSPSATSIPCHTGHDNITTLEISGHQPTSSALSGIFVLILLTIFYFISFMAQPDTVMEDAAHSYPSTQ